MLESTPAPAAGLAFGIATDLQDNLLTASHDLERLQALLDDSHGTLQAGFFGTLQLLQDLHAAGHLDAAPLEQARNHLACAVKALQFQDMASQLIAHTGARLRNCADRLARDAFVGDEDGEAVVDAAPLRANPVTQSEMDTGFVELF
jgi:hypothetical protein